jgi:hypothetical protein
MKNSRKVTIMLGAAASLVLAATASAQDTTRTRPRSTTRIPISKDAPARVDTVTVYKTDTVRVSGPTMTRVDTVRVPGPTNTVTRYDTVRVEVAPMVRLPSGLYFGLGGGSSEPTGALFTPNGMGYSAQAQLGWQGAKNLIGLRIDANYAQPGEDSQFASAQGDPDILNFNGDVRLNIPWFNHLFGITPRFTLYGIGGGSLVMFKNLPFRLDATTSTGQPTFVAGQDEWQNQWGWNAGGGAAWAFGGSEIFIESRVIAFDPDNAPMARQIPITFGMNWYFR